MDIEGHKVFLRDEGTMDTVLTVDGCRHSFSQEYAADMRDETGALTDAGFKELADDALDDHLTSCIEEEAPAATCDRCAHEKTSHRLGTYLGESEGKCIVARCHCEAYRAPRPLFRGAP